MKNRKAWGFCVLLAGCVLYRADVRAATETIFDSGQDSFPDMSILALPPDAIELKLDFCFPDEKRGPFLSQPEGFVPTPTPLLYISDMVNNEIYGFDLSGNPIITFGQSGQGPGDLLRPGAIAYSDSQIIVREAGNMRFQFFDLSGKFSYSFKIFRAYTDSIAVGSRIYTTPFLPIETQVVPGLNLIDVLDFHGKVINSFGNPLNVNKHDFPWLNQVILSAGSGNELWAAFKFYPIIRRYTLDGDIQAEHHYTFDIAAKKEGFNTKRDSNRAAGGAQPYYANIVHAIYATDRGAYLIDSTAGGRLIIFFMNKNGQIGEFYWAPIAEKGFACTGLYVQEDKTGKKFYVLNASRACVEVYSLR